MEYRVFDEINKEYLNENYAILPCGSLLCIPTKKVFIDSDWVKVELFCKKDINDDKVFEGDKLKVWIDGYLQNGEYIIRDKDEFLYKLNDSDSYCRINKFELIKEIL